MYRIYICFRKARDAWKNGNLHAIFQIFEKGHSQKARKKEKKQEMPSPAYKCGES